MAFSSAAQPSAAHAPSDCASRRSLAGIHGVHHVEIAILPVAPGGVVGDEPRTRRDRYAIARLAVGQQRRVATREVVAEQLVRFAATGRVLLEHEVLALRPEHGAGARRHAVGEERQLRPRAARKAHLVQLRRVRKRGGDDQLALCRMPRDEAGLPELAVRRDRFDQRRRDGGHAVDRHVRRNREGALLGKHGPAGGQHPEGSQANRRINPRKLLKIRRIAIIVQTSAGAGPSNHRGSTRRYGRESAQLGTPSRGSSSNEDRDRRRQRVPGKSAGGNLRRGRARRPGPDAFAAPRRGAARVGHGRSRHHARRLETGRRSRPLGRGRVRRGCGHQPRRRVHRRQALDPPRKAVLRDSRLLATRSLAKAITAAAVAPGVFISGSAVGYYGTANGEPKTETSRPGDDFLAQLCVDWEKEAERAARDGMRLATIRTGLVLERSGGASRG